MSKDARLNRDSRPVGFAGLSSMISQVEIASPAGKNSDESAGQESHRGSRMHTRPDLGTQMLRQPARSLPRETLFMRWGIGIAITGVLIWLFASHNRPSRPYTSTSSFETVLAPESASTSSNSIVPNPSSSAPIPTPPATTIEPRAEFEPSISESASRWMVRPGVGMNTLSIPQLRYCLAEDIRLKAGGDVVDEYDHSAVRRYNEWVTDYNIRCGEFYYRPGALERAREDVEVNRAKYAAEGRRKALGL